MRFSFIQALGVCAVCFFLAACGGSKNSITTPVGKVQLGMTVLEITNVLGEGQVAEPALVEGEHTMEVRQYPASNGRVYVVRFVDGLVRRWEIQSR